ncbi:MAG: GTPase Era [Bacteroidetes bacterium]|nr:GTPase Era [Bacteroidota bacterium]
MNHKSGYVAILGLPNAGKSTLLNALLGQKIAITNKKPQTTRKKILGILSDKNYQIIFLDTPGILSPSYLLQEKMMEEVTLSVNDADVILLLIDVKKNPSGNETFNQKFVVKILNKGKRKIVLLLNKIDLIKQNEAVRLIEHFESMNKFKAVIPISATLIFNLDKLIETIVDELPEGPSYYPEDIVADENERFFVSEIIREKILELYREEIPYSVEVLISEFKEREENKDFISAEIVVERDTQKAIIIGKGGTAIKKLGKIAREAVEDFLQREVFLELRVKVRKNWRSDENLLKQFGYKSDTKK